MAEWEGVAMPIERGTETDGRLDDREGDLDKRQRRRTRRTREQVRAETGQHCCCPAFSLASK